MSASTQALLTTPESKTGKAGNASSHAKKPRLSPPINSSIDQISYLQRMVGNRQVERLLKSGVVQIKLAIGQTVNDHEQEADRVSEQVMRAPETQFQRLCAGGGGYARSQTEQPGHVLERLQTKPVGSDGLGLTTVPAIVHEVLRSPGQPLDAATRAFMESRFGHDFSQVRVHADAKAAESAELVNALAYTVGRHVVVAEGQPAPNTSAGRRLLAHEFRERFERGQTSLR